MAAEISSGVVHDAVFGLGSASRLCSTSMVFTRTMFTVTPVPATSRARPPSSASWAALPMAYGATALPGAEANGDETATTRPQPAAVMTGTAARTMFSVVHRCWLEHGADFGVPDGDHRLAAVVAADEVEEGIHPPEPIHDAGDGSGRGIGLAEVGIGRHPSVRVHSELATQLVEWSPPRADEGDPPARRGEVVADDRSQPTRRAGDDRDPLRRRRSPPPPISAMAAGLMPSTIGRSSCSGRCS